METDGLRFTLKRKERLRLRRDFQLLSEKGRALQGQFLVLIYRRNGLGYSRIAVSVKRKFGKSNRRNKVRRWIKECFRTRKHQFPRGYDMLFIVRKAASEESREISFQSLCEDMLNICARLRDEVNGAGAH